MSEIRSAVWPDVSALNLAELLAALSQALDITEGQPAGHCSRCCFIGMRVGEALALSNSEMRDLYFTLLLKDLGCSSNAARICELYLTDDLTFKNDFKTVGDSLPQVLRFVLSHTGLKAGMAERFRAIINILQNGGAIARELIETRCHRGAAIARKLRFSETVAGGIQNLDEHWNGAGKPQGLMGDQIPLFSRIALLAQVIDVFHHASGRAAALAEIERRSGTWFDPALVHTFIAVSARDGFWDALADDDLPRLILTLPPARNAAALDDDYLDDIAAAFGEVVDSKSPYTAGHCDRVALFTDMIAEELDLSAIDRRWLNRAALLHDIGKLGVSNSVLDKPGKLDDAEWVEMRQHTVYSEDILSRISAFGEIARIGGAHHERLDGKGYPRGLTAKDISFETRIITTADFFDALTADRPYRSAMPVDKALSIMEEVEGTAIDSICLAALKRALLRIDRQASRAA
ncbi:HD-GYP domain-containing protein (c-di-GMP phosphodiesterase class II) [Ensifer adhaerens]|uniref:HD-GYP domain-containing protein (C-di-GMP phosphodiesterase class II) n=1 Tax=Ensifer adhaerens TaxID=106592 RepID=A0ACC5T347_ENSAD|nr:HD-GYP domain-containing protein [Ensifer adhaerens]MBP1875532.1 HD-GYP domain-containing protein (c-di-GMP phosphodiesterase class II) [Ensifer adhaerens]